MRSISTDGIRSTTSAASVDLALGRGAEARAVARPPRRSRQDIGVSVAEDQRAPRADPVDVLVAVDVGDRRALAARR